jgi:hypothetical protein
LPDSVTQETRRDTLTIRHDLQMTLAKARESIVRKFTNYRTRHLKPDEPSVSAQQDLESRKVAASALFDLKTASKGRNHFKRKNYPDIIRRRDQLLKDDPKQSQVGAFQKASKEMWQAADQGYWEREASEENDLSIFEYVDSVVLFNRTNLIAFPEIRSSFPNICGRV